MFDNAHKFTVNGGCFNNITYNVSHDTMSKLKPVENASFKSDRHASCLEGTRVGILENLMDWAKNPHSQPIFWLSGIAGTGKSTISQSFCESLQKENLLGASFFCSRESEDLRQVGKIVPTLAYSLAQHSKEYCEQIAVALESDSTIASQGIKRQLESLLMHPVQNMNMIEHDWHFVLVIDALDECEDRDATQNIISILRDLPAQFYLHVHIFISCRPEYYIQQEFERTSNSALFKLHDMDSEIVQKDIQLYLKSALDSLSEADIACLAEQAGKLFIYAFTQVQYLKKACGPVALQSRVNELLGIRFISKSIDVLYSVLLTKSVENMEEQEKEDAKYFINIIVCLSDPLSQRTLSELWKPYDVASFRSLLNIPDSEDAPIHIFHASFPDYILDQKRCHSEFYCDSKAIHETMTLACMRYMNRSLKLNPCNMQTDDHVSSFSKAQISPGLQYSCKHWTFHLTRCGSPGGEILEELEKFVSLSFFFWMEHISILHLVDSAIPGLKAVVSWLQKHNNEKISFVQSYVYEGQRFLQLIVNLLREYPLQLYYSGMAWLPGSSVLHQIKDMPGNVPQVLRGQHNSWNMCEVTIRHHDGIRCVNFSPDGTQVVAGSEDGSVYISQVATGKQIREFNDHSKTVFSVAFSPDGTQVVSGSMDYTICIWHVATSRRIHQLRNPCNWVGSVAFSPDGKHMAAGSARVCIWDVATGEQVHEFTSYGDRVNAVAFAQEGKQVVFASEASVHIYDVITGIHRQLKGDILWKTWEAISPNGNHVIVTGSRKSAGSDRAEIWDVATGKCIKHSGLAKSLTSVAISQDGKQFASGSPDHTVSIWHVDTGKQLNKLIGHSNPVTSVAFSPNGKQVASGSNDKTVRIWHVATDKQTYTPDGHSKQVNSIAFSLDGTQVVSGSNDETVCIWDVATGKQIHKLGGFYYASHLSDLSSEMNSVAFSPDGKQVASGSDKTVYIWDVATGKQIHRLIGHSAGVISVAFSPDGEQIVSASWDNTVYFWNVTTGNQIYQLDGNHMWLSSVPGIIGKTIRIWDIVTGTHIDKFSGHFDWVSSVVFSQDGKLVVSGSRDCTICIWDVATGKQIHRLEGHSKEVRSVTFSPDGKLVVSGSADTTVCIWDVVTGKQAHILRGHSYEVDSVAFLPDGHLLVSHAPGNKAVCIWDVTTGKQTDTHHGELAGHAALSMNGKLELSDSKGLLGSKINNYIWDVFTGDLIYDPTGKLIPDIVYPFEHIKLITPDTTQVMSQTTEYKVCVWDVTTGKQMHVKCFFAHCGDLSNEKLIVSGLSGILYIWDVATGKQIHKIDTHSSDIGLLLISPDGQNVLSVSEYDSNSEIVCIWNIATGERIFEFKGHYRNVNSVAFSPDGKQVVFGSKDKRVCIWDVATGKQIQQLGDQSPMLRSVTFSPLVSGESPDGMQVICKVYQGTIHQWNVSIETQTQNTEPDCHISSDTLFSLSCQDGFLHFSDSDPKGLHSLKFWILPQYQDISRISYHGSTICFGCKSGAIVIIQMDGQSGPQSSTIRSSTIKSPISRVLAHLLGITQLP